MSKKSVSNKSDKPNIQRRRVMQGAALSTAAMAAPGLANAVCNSAAHKLASEQSTTELGSILTSEDIAIELVETEHSLKHGQLARVTITNSSHRPIKLNRVSPGAISTQKGVYQLNATLSENPLSIRSGGVYQFWLTPDDGSQASMSSKANSVSGDQNVLGDQNKITPLEVSVVTKLESGLWTGTQRVHALLS